MTIFNSSILHKCLSGLFIAAIGSLLVSAPAPSKAQEANDADVQRIAAIVNDRLISEYDLKQRMRLVIASTGVRPTADVVQRMRNEVLETLIDEKLQIEEATEYDIVADNAEVLNAVQFIAQQNDADIDRFRGMLEQAGVNWNNYLNQIYAQLVWDRLVRARFMGRIKISDEEIDAYLERLKSAEGKPQNRVAEIFLEVDSPTEEASVRAQADRIVAQLNEGARFQAVARQFSQAATAAVGGDVGWVLAGQLEPALDNAVAALEPGELSDPIRTVAGYYVLLLIDRRNPGANVPERAKVTLKQVSIKLGDGDGDGRTEEAALKQVRATTSNCQSLDKAADANGAKVIDVGQVVVGDLAPALKEQVLTLEANQATPIEATENDVRFVYVCEREEFETKLPTARDVENRLVGQQVAMMARRYLRDLRRDATIEYR